MQGGTFWFGGWAKECKKGWIYVQSQPCTEIGMATTPADGKSWPLTTKFEKSS